MEWPARLRSKWPPLYALLAVLVVVLVAGGLVYIRALALEESAALADNDTIAQSVASLILAREDGYLKILQAYVGRFRFREAIKRQDPTARRATGAVWRDISRAGPALPGHLRRRRVGGLP